MNQYRRIVSYLYKYTNGVKGENTGFVRVDTREEGLRIHLRIKDLRMMDERKLAMYFYFHKDDKLGLLLVDEFSLVRGNCEYKKLVEPDFKEEEFDNLSGVVFLDSKKLLYGSCWDEEEIKEENLILEDEKEIKEENLILEDEKKIKEDNLIFEGVEKRQENREIKDGEIREEKLIFKGKEKQQGNQEAEDRKKKEEYLEIETRDNTEIEEDIHNGENIKKTIIDENLEVPPKELTTNPPQELQLHTSEIEEELPEDKDKRDVWIAYEPILFEGAEGIIHTTRIKLQDIAKLNPQEWKLADNLFLKQSYELEGHLMLAQIQMQNDKMIWVLGVPGTYTNRDRYLANIFGFNDYIPLIQSPIRTGGKGYWIREVSF